MGELRCRVHVSLAAAVHGQPEQASGSPAGRRPLGPGVRGSAETLPLAPLSVPTGTHLQSRHLLASPRICGCFPSQMPPGSSQQRGFSGVRAVRGSLSTPPLGGPHCHLVPAPVGPREPHPGGASPAAPPLLPAALGGQGPSEAQLRCPPNED